MLATATHYLHAGLCAIPARVDEKRPALAKWEQYQTQMPTEQDLQRWFANGSSICVLTGSISGNLELLDFDFKAELYANWRELVDADRPGLLDRLVVERSQSGGMHVVYRCEALIPGNLKLAQRVISTDSVAPIEYCGKKVTPRRTTDGRFEATITLIETRGEGGLFLCAPSPGYVLEFGSFEGVPLLTESERDTLIGAAKALNEAFPKVVKGASDYSQNDRPGDEYNKNGDVRGLLQKHGWVCARQCGDNEHWRRPGKDLGQSATLRVSDNVFYVFSSNAAPFEPDQSYSPFAVYAWLEHSGDFQKAASALRPSRAVNGSSRSSEDYFDSQAERGSCREPGDEPPPERQSLIIRSAKTLVREFTKLRAPLIDGVLRRGETMNIISAPKFGKSWLVLSLILAIASGQKWLGRFYTARGKVLLIDNELHPETLASRLPRVAMAMGLEPAAYEDNIDIVNLRGSLVDLKKLSFDLMLLEPGTYDLIVLDAWYRLQPAGSDENSNGDVAELYNLLDCVSHKIDCAFACVHHSSKGNQSGKAVTDVGSGAGAQARASDTHLVMRQHEHDGAVVVDASVRSWAPIKPFCLRWEFPLFNVDETLNPKDLRKENPRARTSSSNDGKPTAEEVREAKELAAREKVLKAYGRFPEGETQRVLRSVCGISGEKFNLANDSLIADGLVEQFETKKGRQLVSMYRLTGAGQVGQVGQKQCLSHLSRVVGQGRPPLGAPLSHLPDTCGNKQPTLSHLEDTDGEYS
jgi:hypothetical protein